MAPSSPSKSSKAKGIAFSAHRRAATALFVLAACLSAAVCAGAGNDSHSAVQLPVAIVFTSRSGPASFLAVPPPPSRCFPGTLFARAIPGKLRLLTTDARLIELTWGKKLPDGSTLVDVMSPSVSCDGRKIVFAGIKSASDHFHIYEVGTDGSGLRQVTGLPADPGCPEPPYLITAADGSKLSPAQRRRIDYDDIDPAYLPDGRIVFASTRLPRKALYGEHRVTNLWVVNADGSDAHQITYNLSGERWPYVLKDGRILYSYWSRTLSRAAADGPVSGDDETRLEAQAARGKAPLVTAPLPNNWWPAVVNPDGTDFRALAKPEHSAAHVRPLFNGNLVYSTQSDGTLSHSPFGTALEQIPPGYIGRSSGGIVGTPADLPRRKTEAVPGPGAATIACDQGRNRSAGLAPWAVSPSPLPGGLVLFSYTRSGRMTDAGDAHGYDYGLYLANDDWGTAADSISSERGTTGNTGSAPRACSRWTEAEQEKFEKLIGLRKIFDEAGTCEGDAQAVYPRKCLVRPDQTRKQTSRLTLASGRVYTGPAGGVSSPDIYANPVASAPGQQTDSGQAPVFVPPPPGLVKAIDFYLARLGKDKDGLPTTKLELELAATAEVSPQGGFAVTLPAGVPLVQFPRDKEGRLATWYSSARDSGGRRAHLAGFAGDHFGYASEGLPRSFCVGCHAGHTVLPGRSIADLVAAP